MVGMLRQRRSASGGLDPLLLGLGRRGAPGLLLPSSFWFEDDWFRMDPFEEMWRRHVSTFSQALEEHLQLTLPWLPERQTLGARQPLLARVLAAGAAPGDAGVGGADGGGPKPRMPMWVDAGPPWLPGHGTGELAGPVTPAANVIHSRQHLQGARAAYSFALAASWACGMKQTERTAGGRAGRAQRSLLSCAACCR